MKIAEIERLLKVLGSYRANSGESGRLFSGPANGTGELTLLDPAFGWNFVKWFRSLVTEVRIGPDLDPSRWFPES